MTQWYMLTIPKTATSKRQIRILFDECDVKKWIIGIEKGKGGYEHYQIRLESSRPDFFDYFHDRVPQAHIMKAESQDIKYERKEGRFWKHDDSTDILKCRFGKPRKQQQRALEALRRTNDREIVVWYDNEGRIGKSWLCGHLWETGKSYYVPPITASPSAMVQDIASDYINNGWRDYIIIDIPRAWKWTDALSTALESVKDGLIKELRYRSQTINIRGCKILVMTNSTPIIDDLSRDRWIILNREAVKIPLESLPKPPTKPKSTRKKKTTTKN